MLVGGGWYGPRPAGSRPCRPPCLLFVFREFSLRCKLQDLDCNDLLHFGLRPGSLTESPCKSLRVDPESCVNPVNFRSGAGRALISATVRASRRAAASLALGMHPIATLEKQLLDMIGNLV